MTIPEIYSAFLAGKTLPSLSMSTARKLLDICRSNLLATGRKLKPIPTDESGMKSALLDARKELVGGPQVYAQSDAITAMALNVDQITKRAAELEAKGDSSPWLNAFVETQQAKSAPATRPAAAAPAPAAAAARPAPPAKPASGKPQAGATYRQYLSLKKTNPRAAGQFWQANKDSIFAGR